jgi:hypothetical protein
VEKSGSELQSSYLRCTLPGHEVCALDMRGAVLGVDPL